MPLWRRDRCFRLHAWLFLGLPVLLEELPQPCAPAIDLIDGETLCGSMKDLGLGVHVKVVQVEEVSLDDEFFAAI